jgi:hypothetical protein
MLRVFRRCLALRVNCACLSICFLVLEIKLGQLALHLAHPSVDHHLLVVERAIFLRSFEGASAALETAARAGLEQRLGRGSRLESRLGWDRVRINLG